MNNDMRNLMQILSYKRPHGSACEEEFIQRVLMKRCPQLIAIGPEGSETNYAVEIGRDSKTLFSCHLDTVHREGGRQQPKLDKELEMIFAPKGECLGADNGAGIWLLLSMIDAQIPGYYIFHRGEEKGGIGSRWLANNAPKLLKGFDRAIAFDRRDGFSIITHQGGERCCSQIFALALAEALQDRHEPDSTGSFTDTKSYVELIPECTNVSVGYLNEHGPSESLDTSYLFWLATQVKKIKWEELPTVRDPSVVERRDWRTYYSGFGYGYGAGGAREEDDWGDTTTTYEETLDFVHKSPGDAAWLLQNYMEENGLNLSDLVSGLDEEPLLPPRAKDHVVHDANMGFSDKDEDEYSSLYGG